MNLADKIGIGIFLFTLLTFCGLFGATFLFKGSVRMPVDEADESSYHLGNESQGDSTMDRINPFRKTRDAFQMLGSALRLQHIEPDPLSRSSTFRIKRFWKLFYRADNTTCVAGHVRLFTSKPPKGWVIFTYAQTTPEWALHRVWNFGLFAVHHIEPGKKYTCEPGWYVTWAKLKLSAAIKPANIYNPTKPERR